MSAVSPEAGRDWASAPKKLVAFISSHSLSLPNMGQKPRLHGLHGLRATAALMIVLFHLHGIPQLAVPDSLKLITTHFGFGVHIFFVLSAFSLAFSNPRAIDDIGSFYLKRFFRIAPLFYIMLLVYSLRFHFPPLPVFISNFTFTFNFIPGKHESWVWAGWTIGVEMLFYAILPLLLAVCTSARLLAVGAILTLLVSFASYSLMKEAVPAVPSYAMMAFPSTLAVFFSGIVAYRIYDGLQGQHSKLVGLAALVVGIALMAYLLSPASQFLLAHGRADILAWSYGFAAICLWQALYPCWPFNTTAAQWIGERSFSIYLLHPLLIYSLGDVYVLIYSGLSFIGNWAFLVCAAITIPILLALSAFTYWLIEGPGYALGTYVRRRRGAGTERAGSIGIAP